MTINKNVSWLLSCAILGIVFYYWYPEQQLPSNVQIDYIVVEKSKHELSVFSHGKLLKIYPIAIGKNPIGRKEVEGDNKTPEGMYCINDKNPNSSFHKNLGISYPNTYDSLMAKGSTSALGKDIKIHGLKTGLGFIGKFHRFFDWTAGCIAVKNSEINELYNSVPIGTTIELKP
jgi:murein L,D-transpeptidase YafK